MKIIININTNKLSTVLLTLNSTTYLENKKTHGAKEILVIAVILNGRSF